MLDRPMEQLTLSCYDVELRVVDAAGAGICERLLDTLPPQFVALAASESPSATYHVEKATKDGRPAWRVTRDGNALVCEEAFASDLPHYVRQDIDSMCRSAPHACCSCMRVWLAGEDTPLSFPAAVIAANLRWWPSSSGAARCIIRTNSPCSTIQAGSTRKPDARASSEMERPQISVWCARTNRSSRSDLR